MKDSKTPRVYIKDAVLHYVKYDGLPLHYLSKLKSFSIAFNDIIAIALSPRMPFDDEIAFALIVEKDQTIYTIPHDCFQDEGFHQLEDHFKLEPVIEEWDKFDLDAYSGIKTDMILYPKALYWEGLFKRDWKYLLKRIVLSPNLRWYYGNLRDELKV